MIVGRCQQAGEFGRGQLAKCRWQGIVVDGHLAVGSDQLARGSWNISAGRGSVDRGQWQGSVAAFGGQKAVGWC